MIKSVCVFAGSSSGANHVYMEKTRELAILLAAHSIELIYGGGNIGLMGSLATTVLGKGGVVRGVIPRFIHENIDNIELTELRIVDDMHSRKATMYELSDAFIAVPGGIGTLEELLEIYTWGQLGRHEKPVAVYSINGFFDGLLAQLDHMVEEGFLKIPHRNSLIVKSNPQDLLEALSSADNKYVSKW